MVQRRSLGHLAQEPLFNTRAVAQQTGVPPDTFRAWERRYGFPHPHRTSGNQRLYSERDIATIVWLRERTDEGMMISQAIQRLRLEHPEVFRSSHSSALPVEPPRREDSRPATLSVRLVDALSDFDSSAADQILDEALGLFTIEEVCLAVIEPALVDIGDRWERGVIPAGVEHFATRLIMRRLSLVFNLVSSASGRGKVVAVCAPGEEHEVGLMMLSIFLARRNWRVIVLGGGVPIDDLIETIDHIEPDVVCIGASTAPTAISTFTAADQIIRQVNPAPAVVYGGRAFTLPEVRGQTHARTAHYLHGSPDDLSDRLADIIERRNAVVHRQRVSARNATDPQ